MLTSLKLQNFKIGERRSFSFERISVLEGGVGAARAIALDAFRLLLAALRGRDTADFPSSWIAESDPTRLSVSLATYDCPELVYAVTMRRMGGETQILDEQVSAGGRVVLTRVGGRYHVGAKTLDDRRIADTRLALADAAKYLPDDSPVHEVRRELQDVWIVAPDAFRMGSGVGGVDAASGDSAFSQLATYITFRAHASEAIRESMLKYLREVRTAAITGFSVAPGADGRPNLVVRHANDLDAGGVPFGSLDNGEKMLFLAAFVCAVNENSIPLSVVWDSPTNWLGGRGGPAVVKMLRRSFARRGQLVMLA